MNKEKVLKKMKQAQSKSVNAKVKAVIKSKINALENNKTIEK